MEPVVLLNVRETCKILRVSKVKVLELIKEKKLRAVQFGNNTSKFRILSSDVQAYLINEYQNSNRESWDKRYKAVKNKI